MPLDCDIARNHEALLREMHSLLAAQSARSEEHNRQIEALTDEIRESQRSHGERIGALEQDNHAIKMTLHALWLVLGAIGIIGAWLWEKILH